MKKVKIFLSLLLILSILVIPSVNAAAKVVKWSPSNDLLMNFPYSNEEAIKSLGISGQEYSNQAMLLVNADTGTVLYSQNADKKYYPASTTKIMTCLLALEIVEDIDATEITAKSSLFNEFYGIDISTAGIVGGETLTVRQLLYCMLLQSANEAASIIADYLGNGSRETFAQMMTQRAKELGCKNTNFVNAHGLQDENHYTTAHDLYLIASEAMKYDVFREIISTSSYKLTTNKRTGAWLTTTNSLIRKDSKYYYSPVCGIKTGTTTPAGRCLVSYASSEGYNYLCVMLNTPYKDSEGKVYSDNFAFMETKELYKWAFSNFEIKTVISEDETVGEIPVKYSDETDFVLLNPAEKIEALIPSSADVSSIQRIVEPSYTELEAPIKAGSKVGTITLRLNGQTVAVVDAVAAQDIERSELLYYIDIAKNVITSKWFLLGAGAIFFFLAVYIIIAISSNNRRKRRRRRSARRRY